MKKLLMGSVALSLFSISMLLFQLSCKKEATAQTTNSGVIQSNKIIFRQSGDVSTDQEIWIADYDGSNQKKINWTPPATVFNFRDVKISPDGKTIFIAFHYQENGSSNTHSSIVSLNADGTNPKVIIDRVFNPSNDREFINLQAY